MINVLNIVNKTTEQCTSERNSGSEIVSLVIINRFWHLKMLQTGLSNSE